MTTAPTSRVLLWLLFGGSLAVVVLALGGYFMVGSFAAARSTQAAQWQRVGWMYLGLAAIALLGVVTAVRGLLRSRHESR